MGSEWCTKTLGDVIELKRGYDLPKQNRQTGDVPIISSSGVSDVHLEAKVTGPGVITGRYGTIGQVFYSEADFWPLNTTLYVKDFKGNDPKFVYYFLQTINYGEYSDKAAVPGVNRNHLHMANISFPSDISTQRGIAHILGTLDDKIELNRQMNTTLEAMAQALFKSWFVDFDPVIDNALAAGNPIPDELAERAERRKQLQTRPASEHLIQDQLLPTAIQQQFPDRFVFNEGMGWVPENWGVGTLLDQADLLSGGTPKTDVQEYWGGEIPWASAKDVSQCADAFLITTDKRITKRGLDKSATKLIDKYSTVIVSRGATTGRLAMFGDTFAMNQTCYALRSKDKNFFFQYCKTLEVTAKLVFSAHGSIFDTITTSTFKATPIILEDAALVKAFEQRVEPIFLRIYANLVQSSALSSTRDLLLPKLLSGQLRIPEAEQLLAEVI